MGYGKSPEGMKVVDHLINTKILFGNKRPVAARQNSTTVYNLCHLDIFVLQQIAQNGLNGVDGQIRFHGCNFRCDKRMICIP